MSVTVGKLEDMLRGYNKETEIHTSCGRCHLGSMGDNTIGLEDNTNQTYGYLTLNVNNKSTANEKEFYETEISRLNRIVSKHVGDLKAYKDLIDSMQKVIDRSKWMMDNE